MPVLQTIRKQFIKTQPLAGVRVSACLHVTTETANLMITLRDGGASVVLCASNPLSTQDDVAASPGARLRHSRLRHQGREQRHLLPAHRRRLDHKPQITMDDGADLVTMLHTKRTDLLAGVIGGTEETTTGVIRLRAMAQGRRAEVPHHRGQRRAHQAPVRQPLRHRPEHHRRHHPRHQRAAGRARTWWSPATAGAGAAWPCGRAAWAPT